MSIVTLDGHTVSDGGYVWEAYKSPFLDEVTPILSKIGFDKIDEKRCWKHFTPAYDYCQELNAKKNESKENPVSSSK